MSLLRIVRAGFMSATMLAATTAAIPVIAPAAAQEAPPEFTIDVQGWTGGAVGAPDDPGQFAYCSVSKAYDNGLSLIFSMNADKNLNIGILNPEWTLEEGAGATQAQISIDGATAQAGGIPAGPNVLVFPAGANQEVLTLLRQGNNFDVTVNGQTHSFGLVGSSASLAALGDCVDKAVELAAASPQQQDGMTRAAMAGLLEQAGFEDIAFAREENLPPGVVQGWQVNEVLGGLVQQPRESDEILIDEFAEEFVQAVAEGCPDPLERQDQSTEVIDDRYGVKIIALRCRTGEEPTFMSVLFAVDDYRYSAFFHQGTLEQEQAVTDATAALAEVIRGMAENADTPAEGEAAPAEESTPEDAAPAEEPAPAEEAPADEEVPAEPAPETPEETPPAQ